MPSSIVVGYDGSEGARAALARAVDLAKLDGSRLIIVFGFEIPAAWGGETGDYRRAVRELGEERTRDAVERVRDAGVEFEVELVPERPAEGLVSVAERNAASVIVVGTNGERPIKGVVLGSVPHKLLHISPVPVLVVPKPEAE
jgi:nucleotide-binding universal stress UspA family protein